MPTHLSPNIMSTTQQHQDDEPRSPDHLQYEFGQLEKLRDQILHDMEALRLQETNLRAYEARLRAPTAVPVGASRPPIAADSIEAEWEKLQRSRALLEAERRALTDERIALREEREALKKSADALRQREAWFEAQERARAVKAMPPPIPAKKKKTSLTEAPFIAAKSLLSFGRAH